uniref:HMG box domain-containing protein n=1 Tax=Mandrillus leucophaeus TaxID=9568 RepID=A0A2K5YIR9_MANLE
GQREPKKPRGKMSSYAFFVQTCWEEHKKKHPDASVSFSEFSKKWKTMSAKEKGKFEDTAKANKAHYEREMKTYIAPKGETKKKFKDPNVPKRPPLYGPKIKGEHPGLSIGDVAKTLGDMWNNTAADDKQPYDKKAAKLKEKYEKEIAPDTAKKGVVKAEKSKKRKRRKMRKMKRMRRRRKMNEEDDHDE